MRRIERLRREAKIAARERKYQQGLDAMETHALSCGAQPLKEVANFGWIDLEPGKVVTLPAAKATPAA